MIAVNLIDTFSDFDFPSSGLSPFSATNIPSYGTYDMASATLLPQTHGLSRFMGKVRLSRALERYKELEAGWDGYSADAAIPESVIEARLFLSVIPERFDLPVPMLACDGEVSLYWETSTAYLETSFPGDGTFHYIFNAPGQRIASDDIDIGVPSINKEFLGCLEAI